MKKAASELIIIGCIGTIAMIVAATVGETENLFWLWLFGV